MGPECGTLGSHVGKEGVQQILPPFDLQEVRPSEVSEGLGTSLQGFGETPD